MLDPVNLGILLLCMHLDGDNETGTKPLSSAEWDSLAKKLIKLGMSPKDFLDFGDEDFYQLLNGNIDEINRYKKLMTRGNRLSNELTRINEIGISVITRADNLYPMQIKKRMGSYTPPILFVAGNIELLFEPLIGVIGSRELDDKDKTVITSLVKGILFSHSSLISGGHTGIDGFAEQTMLDEGGRVVSVIADSLINRIRIKGTREELIKGTLLLLSPYGYNEQVSVENLLVRNFLLIELSRKTIIVKTRENDDFYYPSLNNRKSLLVSKCVAVESAGKKSAMNDFISNNNMPSVSRKHIHDQTENITAILEAKQDLANELPKQIVRTVMQEFDFRCGTTKDASYTQKKRKSVPNRK